MIPVKCEVVDGKPLITVRERFLWWTWERQFVGTDPVGGKFWTWLEKPHNTTTYDSGRTCQLDAWARNGIT
jgi:hypothetical protein